jgi:hypothetical protein
MEIHGAEIAARFWPKVDKTGECWEWLAGKDRCGYGQFSIARKHRGAHRVSWELTTGPIPEGLQLDHLCRNRACVNPAHLEPVTYTVNYLRGEGVGARNLRKTACPRGHALDEANTFIKVKRNGRIERNCRTCRNAQNKAGRLRRQSQEGR